MNPDFINQEMPRTYIIPFESEHRYMATLHHDHSGHAFVFKDRTFLPESNWLCRY